MSSSGAPYTVTLIPGDGTGPELTQATVRVLEATGVRFEWDVQNAGENTIASEGTPLPDRVIESIRRNKVAIKGPITTPIGTGFRSVNVALRKALDLYVNLRPARYYKGVRSRYEGVDLVVVRENTEDVYAGIEFERGLPATAEIIGEIERRAGVKIRPDSGLSIKPISVTGTKRIVEFAFDYAEKNNRTKVTVVTKANIMKFTDGLFLEVAREVAAGHPTIEFQEMLVDNMAMQLVQKPEEYDVLVMPNLYGDVLSDECAGLVGGLGVAPGANLGEHAALFEPVHGSAPKYTGQNKVNPTATMLSGVLMLRHLGETAAADSMEAGIAGVIAAGDDVTYDLKRDRTGGVGTSQMADAIIRHMRANG
ncbi:MAG TPA: isocitrate/isopropylmalate dehydrogenase family protein [Chloroflexota bacterium]|jgi:isocitrate dehydrogenase (NAD+)|nr:isocitrate/isopropylmalate dehydrogenase family protein [Chloroflexota bacterium]